MKVSINQKRWIWYKQFRNIKFLLVLNVSNIPAKKKNLIIGRYRKISLFHLKFFYTTFVQKDLFFFFFKNCSTDVICCWKQKKHYSTSRSINSAPNLCNSYLVFVKLFLPDNDRRTFLSSTMETKYSMERGWSMSSETKYIRNSSYDEGIICVQNFSFQVHVCNGNVDERVTNCNQQ